MDTLSTPEFTSEQRFENQLIDRLSSRSLATPIELQNGKMNDGSVLRVRNWEYRPDIKTEEDLWENFKKITEMHNQDKLDQPLTTNEFNQIKRVITDLNTPFQAGQFLYGTNGVSEVEVDMDDGRHEFFRIFDQKQVGAGETVYQVVNQIQRPAILPGKKNRRFDVTLLINGLPVVQIELKAEGHPVSEALEQMRQYANERQYSGIFSTLQLLVGMNPNDARYMANTPGSKFNTDFAFHWQKESDNKPVFGWTAFTDNFLSIPMAHNMATTYMVLDGEANNEALKVMRPYQVYATQNVLSAVKGRDQEAKLNKLGYIWHTTGSGKTITSFKTAWLASKLPGVDKVVFLVDRKALTNQTFDKYRAYDPESTANNDGTIKDTKNTAELSRKLKEKNNDIVVTTVQKLERLVKRSNFEAPKRKFLFVVDEAHRSTGGDAFEKIQKAFPNSSWIGYTGTPIFDTGDSRNTTPEIFGKCLHSYTIREAIADRNVLGFKVDYMTTLTEDQIRNEYLPAFYRQQHEDWTEEQIQEKIDNIAPEDMDDSVSKSFYDMNENHVREVVKDISDKWRNRSNDYKYNAILTTHVGGGGASAPMAMMYLREFQRINKEREAKGEKRLKVAVTFSQDTSNSDRMKEINSNLKDAIDIYNEEFGTHFEEKDPDLYMADLTSRLNKTAVDKNYLDLVIVVDQLLTGFDAPELNTLYVDRVLKGANLIQAYSRTNRIADMLNKPNGQIVNYRWPKRSEELMNEALSIYANRANAENPETGSDGGTDGILAEDFKELMKKAKVLVKELREMTDSFKKVPDSEKAREEMLRKLREYSSTVSKMKQFPIQEDNDGKMIGFDYDNPDELISQMGMTSEEEKMLTTTLATELKKKIGESTNVDPILIDLQMTFLKDVVVNYDYLTELIEKLMNEVHEGRTEKAAETYREIEKFANGLEDQNYARDIRDAGTAIMNKEYPTKDSGLTYPYKLKDLKDIAKIVEEASDVQFDIEMFGFRSKWAITDFVTSKEIRQHFKNHTFGERDLDDDRWLTNILKKGQSVFKKISTDVEVRNLSPIKYRNSLRDAFYQLADNQMQR